MNFIAIGVGSPFSSVSSNPPRNRVETAIGRDQCHHPGVWHIRMPASMGQVPLNPSRKALPCNRGHDSMVFDCLRGVRNLARKTRGQFHDASLQVAFQWR